MRVILYIISCILTNVPYIVSIYSVAYVRDKNEPDYSVAALKTDEDTTT